MTRRRALIRFLRAVGPLAYYLTTYTGAVGIAYGLAGTFGAFLTCGAVAGVLAWSHDRCHVERDLRRYGAYPLRMQAGRYYDSRVSHPAITPPLEPPE